jgi:hypothetical protein
VSFRRQVRAAAKAPRTIELDSRSVRYVGRWLTDRGREPVLDQPTGTPSPAPTVSAPRAHPRAGPLDPPAGAVPGIRAAVGT